MNHSKKISKKKYLVLVIFFVFLLILAGIAASYAFFEVSVTNSYTPTNAIVNLDCIDISYTEENTIDLDYNYPITDEYALNNITPVTIKVTNNCTTNVDLVNYTLALTTLRNDEGSIADNKIRFHIKRQLGGQSEEILHNNNYLSNLNFMPKGEILNYLNSDLDDRENANSYTNRSSYIVDNAYIADGATNIYNVYLWIDYYEGDSEVYNGEKHDESYNNSTAGLNFAAALSLVVNPTSNNVNAGGTAFAIYSEDDNSLMFYKNNDIVSLGSTYNGKTVTEIYTGFEDSHYKTDNERPWEDYSDVIESVSFVDEIAPLSTARWFSEFYNVSYIDVTNLNTSKVVDMSYMFKSSGEDLRDSFQVIGMENWNTENVTNMSNMFCATAVYVSQFDIGDIKSWNTSNVTDMSYMFDHAGRGANYTLDISDWGVQNVTNFTSFNLMVEDKIIAPSKFLPVYAFYSETDNSLTFITSTTAPVVGNVYKNKTITALFSNFINSKFNSAQSVPWHNYATSIQSVLVEDKFSPTSTLRWFINFHNCSYFDLTKLDTAKVTDMEMMFYNAGYGASEFQIIGMDDWDTSNVTSMLSMFYNAGYGASEFDIGDLSNWDTSSVSSMQWMFSGAGYNAQDFYLGDLSNWNISKVRSMADMFYSSGYKATNFDIGDLSRWDTRNVTNMLRMFSNAGRNASKFNLGDLSKWNTSQVTDMSQMFRTAGLKATEWYVGYLSNWDTSSVSSMYYMFADSGYNATTYSLDLSKWNTKNVTNMEGMFYQTGRNSTSFTLGDISNWDTRNVTDMYAMFNFAGYSASYSLDLSKWDVRKVTRYQGFNTAVDGKITLPSFVES